MHPSITTRAKSADLQQVANAALQLLRLTNALVGPVSARFDIAFSFTHFSTSRHGGRRLADNEDCEPLNFDLARSGSIWSRAEDFWAVVGWAFNCSVLHRKRWARWRLWLEFICDVLEDDWKERLRRVKEKHGAVSKGATEENKTLLKESLILKYINAGANGTSSSYRHRRIMRAVFADGSPASTNEFREVFYNELKELDEKKDRPQKRQGDVNIEEDQYADYLAQDESEESEEASKVTPNGTDRPQRHERPTRAKRAKRHTSHEDADIDCALDGAQVDNMAALGDLHAITLRQRILHLLSDVAMTVPKDFMDLDELYHLFVDFMRYLPLPVFQLLVSPSVTTGFSAAALVTLCEILLLRLLEKSIPPSDEPYASQEKLVRCYLPYAAKTTNPVDNAKVSLLLESLMRLLHADGMLEYNEILKLAADGGINNRADKAQTDTRKSQVKLRAEEIGWSWLIESGERITCLVERLAAAPLAPAPKAEVEAEVDVEGKPTGNLEMEVETGSEMFEIKD